jgi:hypothetical protein
VPAGTIKAAADDGYGAVNLVSDASGLYPYKVEFSPTLGLDVLRKDAGLMTLTASTIR